MSVDWEASLYIRISLKWDYSKRTMDLSKPDYIKKALTRFQHTLPSKPEFAPYQNVIPNYGTKVQYSAEQDTAQLLDPKGVNTIQSIVVTLF